MQPRGYSNMRECACMRLFFVGVCCGKRVHEFLRGDDEGVAVEFQT